MQKTNKFYSEEKNVMIVPAAAIMKYNILIILGMTTLTRIFIHCNPNFERFI